ncbi:MAG: heat-inducible transcriptional repressor HrcA [candidate division Zixibacteria bacterium]|nr:heat-inducible transcriptional repressor HrcA [candidate division Zixibacteria bacterium]
MAFENLNSRELRVLQNLINHYIQTADPVGSRVIANKFRMGLSPATIRNTMQDLEELGLIRQPHTSAGRIPTDSGYRVFVDMLLKTEPLTEADKSKIRGMVNDGNKGLDAILSQTSRILGEITSQLGITISPKFDEGVLTRIDLIPVADGKLLVIVAVRSGLAKTILMEVESDIDIAELRQMESVLNERLAGLTLGHIRKTLNDRLANTSCSSRLIKLFLDSKSVIWEDQGDEKLHYTGADKLISQPEFADRNRITDFFKLLENQKSLIEFLESKSVGEGIVITIGSENEINEMRSCSLVISKYQTGNNFGVIGILGPTRMPYSKLVSIVDYTAKSLSDALIDL